MLEVFGLVKTEEEKSSLPVEKLRSNIRRDKFSDFLAPLAYDEATGVFYNKDDTIGVMFECTPVLVFGAHDLKVLEGLFRIGYPEGSVIQFILYADPDIKAFLDFYESEKQYAPDFVKKGYHELRKFYEQKVLEGLRNFRSFITIKMPAKDTSSELIREIVTNVREVLQAVMLNPVLCGPSELLQLLRRILNARVAENDTEWTKTTLLSKQVIYADTTIKTDPSSGFIEIKSGYGQQENTIYFRCITPKTLPQDINAFWTNLITGSYEGVAGDVSQINTPFILTLNIFVENLRSKLHTKANLVIQQQAFGSFIPALKRKQEEFIWSVDKVEKGDKFFRIIPIMWLFSHDKEATRTAVYRAIKLWESTGAVMQEDKYLLMPLLCYSLPFSAYCEKMSLNILDRDFVVPLDSLPALLPVQTDFGGAGKPALLFTGRKGQIVGVDILSQASSSYNWYIAAPTGKGKSFLVNYIVANYYGAGTKIRIVDIGGSYKKLAKIFNGKYLEFSPDSNISLNPFSNIKEPEYDIPVITEIIRQMVVSSTGQMPEVIYQESAANLIRSAVEWVVKNYGEEGSVDLVFEWLKVFPKYYDDEAFFCNDEKCQQDFKLIASHLAFNLAKFTSDGSYGKWFSGKSTIDIANDNFVVLELEHLKSLPDLFSVVVLQILNLVTMDLYHSTREVPRMVIVDEAWQFLQDTAQLQVVIETGYRRARKYKGSFGIITQSILDLKQFGRVGNVINVNSAYKFFLESSDFEKAKDEKVINYDDFAMNILRTIKYNAPKYSEIFIHSDAYGIGVGRLMVDPYSYYLYTSNPTEIAEIEAMVSNGMSYEEAIDEMVKRRNSKK